MKDLATNQTEYLLSSEISDGSALLNLARDWLKQGNPVVAADLLKSAITSREASSDKSLRAKILKEIGRTRMMQSEWEIAESHYLEAQGVFLEIEEYKGAAECARNRANMQFQKGLYEESETLCEQALEWASMLTDHELRATILNTLAAIKSTTGDYREALQTFRLCLSDFKAAGNLVRQGYVLLNIGLSHVELREFHEAIGSLNEALSIAFSEKDLSLVEICYQNISKCYLYQKETSLARSVIETARMILPGLNSKALEAELSLLDAQVLRAMGDFDAARELLEKTYIMAVDSELTALQADVLLEQGLLCQELGRQNLAAAKLNAAVHRFQEIGADKGFKEAVEALNKLRRCTDV